MKLKESGDFPDLNLKSGQPQFKSGDELNALRARVAALGEELRAAKQPNVEIRLQTNLHERITELLELKFLDPDNHDCDVSF